MFVKRMRRESETGAPVHVWRVGRGGKCTRGQPLVRRARNDDWTDDGDGCDDGTDRRRQKVKLHFGRRRYALRGGGLVVAAAAYGRAESPV